MKKYVFREYDKKFPEYYSRKKKQLITLLGPMVKIEHIGSSSVPGLGGKGFIDILIGSPTKDDHKNNIEKMLSAGYHYEPKASTNTRYYFDCEFINDSGEESMYHFHLTCLNSEDWIQAIAFRDYLRNNPLAMKKYADIKKHAAEIANQDRSIYVRTKNPVIEELLKLALERYKQ